MSQIEANGLLHYYEQIGEGRPLVFIHGAFADSQIWNHQWDYFSARYRVIRYDLRGHGKTGDSKLDRYRMNTFADDLSCLLDGLGITAPYICGLSWGGSIAQVFAARTPERVKALVLAGSNVSIRLTLMDKLLCDVLIPRWVMLSAIRLLKVENFARFSLLLARLTRGKQWLSQDQATARYLESCILGMSSRETLKIWDAIYGFDLPALEKITCPTLVLNGEYESKSTYRHTKEILRRVPRASAKVVLHARHAMNADNHEMFNGYVEEFLQISG